MKKIVTIIISLFIQIVAQMFQVEALDHNNYSIPVTTIERIASYPNGCYTQRIREPDLSNTKRFYEFDQFICPPSVNVSTINNYNTNFTNASVFQPPYMMPTNSTPQAVPAPTYNHPYVYPTSSVPFAAIPPPAAPSDSRPVVITQNQINPSPVQQSFKPVGIPSNATSHVVLLSNKTGFYDHVKRKSSANSLRNFNWLFVFVFITIFYIFN